jgi:hypothetical protein
MISYEGKTRECANCGHVTNVHSHCATCDMTICEACDHTCEAERPAANAHVPPSFAQALNSWASIGNGLYVRTGTKRGRR